MSKLKAILSIIRSDIQDIVGHLQLRVGQTSSCEAAIHALDNLFDKDTSKGFLLIDTSNVFNNLNRKAISLNVQRMCSSFAPILVNSYRLEPSLFIDHPLKQRYNAR